MAARSARCALCHRLDVELRNSHLLPQWVYDRLQKPHRGSPNPVLLDGDTVVQTSRQLKHHLLCEDCEQLVGRWESYVASLAYADERRCPLLDVVGENRVPTKAPEVLLAEAGGLDRQRLAAFVVSVIWRFHVAATVNGARRFFDLGPYEDTARRYLRTEVPFPRTFRLLFGVYHDPLRPESPGWPMSTMAALPGTDRDGAVRRHQFIACGLHFQLYVGQVFTPFHDEHCLIHARPPRLSVITPTAGVIQRLGRDVVHARPVGRLAKDPKWRAITSIR